MYSPATCRGCVSGDPAGPGREEDEQSLSRAHGPPCTVCRPGVGPCRGGWGLIGGWGSRAGSPFFSFAHFWGTEGGWFPFPFLCVTSRTDLFHPLPRTRTGNFGDRRERWTSELCLRIPRFRRARAVADAVSTRPETGVRSRGPAVPRVSSPGRGVGQGFGSVSRGGRGLRPLRPGAGSGTGP